MDNGQDTRHMNDLIKNGITTGVGTMPDGITTSQEDNLNSNNFTGTHGFGKIGDQVLSVPEKSNSNSFSIQDDADSLLGQIIDISTPQSTGSSVKQEPSTPQQEQNPNSIDTTIAEHLADGKVNHDDAGYLKSKTEELANDPAKLAEFIMTARRTITNRTSGGAK